jgi:HEAT repeat protein
MKTLLRAAALVLLTVLLPAPGVRGQDPGKMEEVKKEKLAKAVNALATGDEEEQYHALENLRELKVPSAVEPIVDFAEKTRYAHLAHHAGLVLAELDAQAALDLLRGRLNNPVRDERRARHYVILLWELGTEPALDLMLSKFGPDTRKRVRIDVLRAIGERKVRRASKLLTGSLTARDPVIRNQAAISIGKLDDPDLAPALVSALSSTDRFHGQFAAWALGEIQDPAVFESLSGRLASGRSIPAHAKALEASAMIEAHVPRLIGLLKSTRSRDYQVAAIRALGRLAKGNKEAMSILFQVMLRERDVVVSGLAFSALAKIVDGSFAPQLLKRAGQQDPRKVQYVYELLGDLKVADAAPMMMRRIFKESRNEFVWKTAAINLWKIDDRETNRRFEELVERSTNRDGTVRAIQALGFRANDKGFRFLANLLRRYSEGSAEQFAVEQALERMTGHLYGTSYALWRQWYEQHPDFFTPKQQELDRKKWREEFDKENRGFRQTTETEAAVQRGLRWLARHQDGDGAWDPQKYMEHDEPGQPGTKEGARVQLDPVGTTALTVLAFLGAGYTPTEGKYSDEIARGLEYILARQLVIGDYLENDLVGGYNRPIALMALAEAYNITKDERYVPAVEVGADFLSSIQNSLGGWRYRVRIETTDTSCCSWNAFALKTAEKSGIRVREIVFEGIRMVFDLYSSPVTEHREEYIEPAKKGPDETKYGFSRDVGYGKEHYKYWTGYQNNSYPDSKYATVALGLMTRIFLGNRRTHPFCIGAANAILEDFMEEIPAREDWSRYRSRREYPTYAWYYGTLAMHQMGGRYFRLWNERIKKIVPGTQIKEGPDEGTWPVWNHDMVGGVLYTTCMGVLTLETYYRYVPILED